MHLFPLSRSYPGNLTVEITTSHNSLCKISPRTRSLIGCVVDAIVLSSSNAQNCVCQIICAGRITYLIINNTNLWILCTKGAHGCHKIFANIAVKPCRSHYKRLRICRKRKSLSRQFGAPIRRNRIRSILLCTRRAFFSTKNIISRYLNKLCLRSAASSCKIHRAKRIYRKGHLKIALTAIYICCGRTVNNKVIAIMLVKPCIYRF